MSKVTVCRFRGYDIQKGEMVIANRRSTLAGIKAVKGTPIGGTGVKIDDALLGPDEWELSAIGFQP